MIVLLYLLAVAPKLLLDFLLRGKKHPGLAQRLGFSLPVANKPVIWLHAVSVGEIKAAQPLFRELRKRFPNHFFLITTTTETGNAEAKRSLSGADAFSYLPVDFKWVVRRWVKHFRPELFLLVESDFWPNLLSALKQSGCKNILVSGKLSERSARRFKTFSRFAKRLFSRFDLLCLQNEEHYQRFLPLVSDSTRLHVTGNLKLDIEPQKVDIDLWRKKIAATLPMITISCTHDPEEEMLLDALDSPNWLIFLVPRHPERFQEIAQLLNRKKIPFTRWSQLEPEGKRVILIDAMGQLPICYSLSRLAIVAGSYIPKIGGHNVLEPCLYGTPVFFGPHMFAQAEFATRVLEAGAGRQVPLQNLRQAISKFLNETDAEEEMKEAGNRLILQGRGATSRVLELFHQRDILDSGPKLHKLGQYT